MAAVSKLWCPAAAAAVADMVAIYVTPAALPLMLAAMQQCSD